MILEARARGLERGSRLKILTVTSHKSHHSSSLVLFYFWILEGTPPFLDLPSTVEPVFTDLCEIFPFSC